jgi:hypothetical protein
VREGVRFGGLQAIALTHPTLADFLFLHGASGGISTAGLGVGRPRSQAECGLQVVGDRRINRSWREHTFFDQQFPFCHRVQVIDIEHGNRSSANWR